MSNKSKKEALIFAKKVAIQAATNERLRCLWCLDQLLQKCQKDLENKVIPAAEMQMVKVRFEITRSLVNAAKILIARGVAPQKATLTPTEKDQPPPTEEPRIVVP